jgi:hydrogenase maturation factor HypE
LRKGNIRFTESLLSQNSVFESFSELNIDTLSIGIDGILLFQDSENILTNRIAAANMGFAKVGLKY